MIGRIVHMWTHQRGELAPIAAIVTYASKTEDGRVDLTAFPPNTGPRNYESVLYSEQPKYGFWTWPERIA